VEKNEGKDMQEWRGKTKKGELTSVWKEVKVFRGSQS
jgi:hypothetical protein